MRPSKKVLPGPFRNIFRRRVRTLDRYVVSQMGSSFLFGVLVFSVLLVAGDLLFQIANLVIDKGVSLGVVIRLFIYKLPEVVVMTLPMASLLSALLTFGRLSSQSEIVALRASGISFRRIVRPVLAASIFVSLGAMLLNETIVPLSNRAADNIMRYDIARERPTLLREQVFLRDDSGGVLNRVIYISKLRQNLGTMEDILIQEFEKGAMFRITSANRGTWSGGEWWLDDGKTFEVQEDRSVKLLFSFARQKLPLLLGPSEVARTSQRPAEMSAWQLWEHISIMSKQGASLAPLWVMFHLKLAVPWACVILAVLGASLGVGHQRSGAGVGVAMSVLVVFAYYVVMSFSRSFGQAGYFPPFIAAWAPNIIFMAIAVTLARYADR
ncbi:MAG: LPS export ABC transporter permease LptG [Thermovirgaceae bacterium]|nr:LPS export ABC transporter permease LptG [Thermovirgaceae bacterium]